MVDYRDEIERRVAQFLGYLRRMHGRAHEEARGPCFLIFEERKDDDAAGGTQARKRAALVAVAPSRRGDPAPAEGGEGSDAPPPEGWPTEGWRTDDGPDRFVQFSFEKRWFCMDMPRQTLWPEEARRILRDRGGFFFLRDRPEFTLYGEDVEGFDPFRKVYVYGDEETAAADTAFVFFEVWRFPPDARLYVTSAAFGKDLQWERGVPLG